MVGDRAAQETLTSGGFSIHFVAIFRSRFKAGWYISWNRVPTSPPTSIWVTSSGQFCSFDWNIFEKLELGPSENTDTNFSAELCCKLFPILNTYLNNMLFADVGQID